MKTLNATPSKTLADILADNGIEPLQGQTIGVQLEIRVKGNISKGEDYESAQTCNALGILDVCRVLAMAGITRERALELVTASALGETKCKEETEKMAVELVESFKEKMQSLPKAKRDGKRTGKFVLTCEAGII